MTEDCKYRGALTLGATGMLKGALTHISERTQTCWVLSRQGQNFIADNPHQSAKGLAIDYSDPTAFWRAFDDRINVADLELALLWVHDHGKPVLIELLRRLTSHNVKTIHVSGSATGNPAKQMERVGQYIDPTTGALYIPVVLGAMKTPNGQRWLTHEEISQGAIRAIETNEPQMVGTQLSFD